MKRTKVWHLVGTNKILCETHLAQAQMWRAREATAFEEEGICMECLAREQLDAYQGELENDDGTDSMELLAAMVRERRKNRTKEIVADILISIAVAIFFVWIILQLTGCFKEEKPEGMPELTMMYCQTDINRRPDMMHCYTKDGSTYNYMDIQAMEGDVCLICCDAGWNDAPEGTCPAEFCTVCLISAFWWQAEGDEGGPYSIRGGCDKDQRWMVDSYSESSYWATCKQQQEGGYR